MGTVCPCELPALQTAEYQRCLHVELLSSVRIILLAQTHLKHKQDSLK
jgi:hypothetical protein